MQPPARLVYTCQRESPEMDFGETLVTVEFLDREETEVVLTHDFFPTAEVRGRHTQGWTGCLERLAEFLQQ